MVSGLPHVPTRIGRAPQPGDPKGLWQRLLGRPVSESGRLRHGDRTRGWGAQLLEGAKVAYAPGRDAIRWCRISARRYPPGMGHCVVGSGCCALGALFVESHAMGLLTFGLNVTLDGCIDHTQGIVDDELHDYWTQLMDQSGAMLFGRNTYELMEGAWPAVARDEKAPRAMREWAQKLEAKAKYVVSGSRSDFPWQNTIKVEGDLREAISALKAKTERGVLVGAPKLAAALEELGLIDEYRIVVHPIISGRGPTLFHGLSSARHLELLSTQRFKSGVQALHFRRKAG